MKLDIYINWWLSWKHCFGEFHESSGHMGFSGFPSDLVLPQFVFLLKVMLLVSAVSLNILQVIFGVALIA